MKLEDELSKWQIILKSQKPKKQERNEVFRGLIIGLELTLQQREEDYRLRQELRRRREEGERCVIKKGKIVSLTGLRNRY